MENIIWSNETYRLDAIIADGMPEPAKSRRNR